MQIHVCVCSYQCLDLSLSAQVSLKTLKLWLFFLKEAFFCKENTGKQQTSCWSSTRLHQSNSKRVFALHNDCIMILHKQMRKGGRCDVHSESHKHHMWRCKCFMSHVFHVVVFFLTAELLPWLAAPSWPTASTLASSACSTQAWTCTEGRTSNWASGFVCHPVSSCCCSSFTPVGFSGAKATATWPAMNVADKWGPIKTPGGLILCVQFTPGHWR